MNFLVDAQLPPGLARWLADQGDSAHQMTNAVPAIRGGPHERPLGLLVDGNRLVNVR